MKDRKKISPLPLAVLALGAAAYFLRRRLYAVAVDKKGLLIAGHPLELLLWAVVLAGAALILLSVRKLEGSAACEDNFGPCPAAALGHFLMGYTILMMALLGEFPMNETLGRVWKVLGFLSAPAMVWGGICRMKGNQPFFGIHAVTCLFLLLYLVSRYQGWSGNPQLQDYVFELLALVTLTLFAYQHAAFEANMGNRRMLLAMGLLTLLLCGGALFGAADPGLYVSGAFWAMTDLCVLTPPVKDEVEPHDPS